jgi:predicted glycosyltransferase
MKNYKEIAEKLRKQYRQVSILTNIYSDKKETVGIEVFSSALSMFDNVLKIKEIVGNEYKVTGNTNTETITIK